MDDRRISGKNTFALSGQKISGGQTRAVFLSDLDGDGDLDALIARRRQAAISCVSHPRTKSLSVQRTCSATLGHHAAEYYGNPRPGDTLAIPEQQFTAEMSDAVIALRDGAVVSRGRANTACTRPS